MQVRVHTLPEAGLMIGGLAADPERGSLWVSLLGSSQMVWRFDLGTAEFLANDLDVLLDGYSFVHRSIVPAPDGRVYVGASWVMGVEPDGRRPRPFSPGGFLAAAALLRWFGRALSSTRILCREPDGRWLIVADRACSCIDLAWDTCSGRLLRCSPQGVSAEVQGTLEIVAPTLKGFVHQLAVGAHGELVLIDEESNVILRDARGDRIRLGSIGDGEGRRSAAPGLDGLVSIPPNHLVGGSRNRARPFVIDLRLPSLRPLPPSQTTPRASAFCVGPAGKIYFATGVGRVGLYRMGAEDLTAERVGLLATEEVACHHVHDLVALPDGRMFAGEFYPLDVPNPPAPPRDCLLWELVP